MNFARAGLFSAAATAARLLSGLVVIKLVAYFAGPTGVAKLGQFMSLMSLLIVIAGGGLGSGIVKYVAEYKNEADKLERLLSASLFYTLVASLVTGIATLLFSQKLALWLLGSLEYQSLIWILAIAQALVAMNNYIVAVFNGFLDIKRVAFIQILGAIFSIMLTALLAYFLQLYGALLGLVLSQAALIMLSFPATKTAAYFKKRFFIPQFDRKKITLLARYSMMTLTSALLTPLVHLWIRDYLAGQFSWTEVGYWQAVSKVSEAYLLFITMAINVYYLPKLSAIKYRQLFVSELCIAYKYIMPIVAFLAILIYFARDIVSSLLFTPEFIAARELYAPQLFGDVIKIASFILAYVMLAKAMTARFLLLEIIFSVTYIGFVWVMTKYFGLIGAMYAFVINYFIYFLCTAWVARSYINNMRSVEV